MKMMKFFYVAILLQLSITGGLAQSNVNCNGASCINSTFIQIDVCSQSEYSDLINQMNQMMMKLQANTYNRMCQQTCKNGYQSVCSCPSSSPQAPPAPPSKYYGSQSPIPSQASIPTESQSAPQSAPQSTPQQDQPSAQQPVQKSY